MLSNKKNFPYIFERKVSEFQFWIKETTSDVLSESTNEPSIQPRLLMFSLENINPPLDTSSHQNKVQNDYFCTYRITNNTMLRSKIFPCVK
jgi:hypothetical protein